MVGISAVIPCCNVKHEYIACVLDSVLAQTFQNYEVILVDDGSQEPYREILVDAAKKDPRIRLVTQDTKASRLRGTWEQRKQPANISSLLTRMTMFFHGISRRHI